MQPTPLQRLSLALPALLLACTPPADGQVIFDDFRYARRVDYSDATKSGSANTLFGVNPWLVGPNLDRLTIGAPTRAWYGFLWQDEFVAYPHLDCPTPPCRDNSVFDGHGAEIVSEPVDDSPGHVALRYHPGSYDSRRLISLMLTSGFAARTGTWVARVRLPGFEGLDSGNGGVGVLMAPMWLKSPVEAWETRATWSENTGGTNWWESNIEIWREPNGWRPYADANYHPPGFSAEDRYVSAGNSWFEYSSAVYRMSDGNVRPANASFGPCRVVHRTRTGLETATVAQQDCLDAIIGRSELDVFAGLDHPYLYVMIQHTGRHTSRYLYARSEDESGRPVPSSGFQSLMLDQVGQENLVDPGYFNAQLEMLLYVADGAIPVGTIGPPGVDMLFDWFLYTPDTDLTIQEAPELARTVRQTLREFNEGRPAGQQVWRANTTGLTLAAPRRAIDPWATCNPWRIEPTRNWDFTVEKTERNGRTFFTAHLVRDNENDLRTMLQSIEWTVVRNGRVVDVVRNQGFTLERTSRWGPDGRFRITASVTQTSPVTYPPFVWQRGSTRACPDSFGSATRTKTYVYDAATGFFAEP